MFIQFSFSRLLHFLVLFPCIVGVLVACEGPFSAERQYVSTMYSHARRTLDTLNTLQDLATNAQLGDDAWEAKVNVQMRTLRNLIAEARQITPPSRFASVHASYLGMMDTLEQMAETYDKAMELQNNEQLQQAMRLLNQAKEEIDRLRNRIEELSQQT